ncbi:MAG: YesL family protein [Lachnospira sp.]
MGVFDINGKLFKALSKMGDFIILAVIMGICCVPVITIGPSLTAAFYAGMKLVKDEENYVFKDFFKSFKRNFVQAVIIEIIIVAVGVFLYFDLRASYYWGYVLGSKLGAVLVYAIAGIGLIWAAEALYVYAVLAKFDNKIFSTIKNALIICVHHLPQTFIMMIATYGLIYFTSIYWTAIILTVPLIIYVDSFIMVRIFKPFEVKAEESQTPENAGTKEISETVESLAEDKDSEDNFTE